jgi:hypothetical protein
MLGMGDGDKFAVLSPTESIAGPMPEVASLTFSEAHALLKQIDCGRVSSIYPSTHPWNDRQRLQMALQFVTERSDYQIFGVCADSYQQGIEALSSYLSALGYTTKPTLQPIQGFQGSVYIKFKPNSDACYVESYTGSHRGVLVSCQSYYADGISEMYGHLPLDLFA